MLTIRFDRLGVRPGDLVLDAGAGFGRHAFALARAGADVVALDYADGEVAGTRATFGGMIDAGEIDPARYVGVLHGDATRLPFADGTFDRVITSEVLEHIQADADALAELCPRAQARRHVRRHRAERGGRRRSTGCSATSTTHRSPSAATCGSTARPS